MLSVSRLSCGLVLYPLNILALISGDHKGGSGEKEKIPYDHKKELGEEEDKL